MLKRLVSECVRKSKSTAAKVSGGVLGAGGTVVGLVFFLHSNIRAEVNDKLVLARLANDAKVVAVVTQVVANNKLNETKFKAVQNTINLQVQTVNQKMKSIQMGQEQVLNMLDKLDRRLYKLNKNSGG